MDLIFSIFVTAIGGSIAIVLGNYFLKSSVKKNSEKIYQFLNDYLIKYPTSTHSLPPKLNSANIRSKGAFDNLSVEDIDAAMLFLKKNSKNIKIDPQFINGIYYWTFKKII